MGGTNAREERKTNEIETESTAKQILNDGTDRTEDVWNSLIGEMNTLSTDQQVMDVLANAYIDGYGFEIGLTTDVSGIAEVSWTPRGISVLNITNSSNRSHVGGPYFYVFSEFAVGAGFEVEASGSVDVIGFIAHYFGEDAMFGVGERNITPQSFAGGTVSVNAEAGAALGEGIEANVTVLASQTAGIAGLTNLATGEYRPGWQGVGGSVIPTTGVGGGVSIDLALARTGPLDEAMGFLFGRPDVEKAMAESEHIEWKRPDEPVEHEELDWATGWLGTDFYGEESP